MPLKEAAALKETVALVYQGQVPLKEAVALKETVALVYQSRGFVGSPTLDYQSFFLLWKYQTIIILVRSGENEQNLPFTRGGTSTKHFTVTR